MYCIFLFLCTIMLNAMFVYLNVFSTMVEKTTAGMIVTWDLITENQKRKKEKRKRGNNL